MPQLLCHLFGDYCLQSHWMAQNKVRDSFVCLVHVIIYTMLFLFITRSTTALAIIGITHFFIDRFQLAKWWVRIYGIGHDALPSTIADWYFEALFNHASKPFREVFNYEPLCEPYLAVWLLIIVDNSFHLLINYLAITYYG